MGGLRAVLGQWHVKLWRMPVYYTDGNISEAMFGYPSIQLTFGKGDYSFCNNHSYVASRWVKLAAYCWGHACESRAMLYEIRTKQVTLINRYVKVIMVKLNLIL